ncbi:MAG: AAA family ATPase [Planctomycetota bacterium]|jgi:MoxR-like ATPase
MDPNEAKARADTFRAEFEKLRAEIGKVIVGQHEIVEGVLICLFVGGHALLEGVPGLGKTLLIRTLADALSLKFNRIQFTPDLMPADILGTNMVMEDEGGKRYFEFQQGPIFSQVVLADEINRATPKTQSALLEAMQEKQVTAAGTRYTLERPFFVLATQNPIEQEGTYPLPEAQLDRFFFKLVVGYPSSEELHMVLDRTTEAVEAKVEPVLDGPTIVSRQQLVRDVVVAPHVKDYAVRLVKATHPGEKTAPEVTHRYVRWGASPRAGQTLVLAGKVRALLDGRYNVSFDDIKNVLLPAMRHRLILNFEGEAEGKSTDDVLNTIMESVPTAVETAEAKK